MNKPRKRWALAALGLVLSILLLHYAYWLSLVRRGNVAMQQDREAAVALRQFQKAVDWSPPLVGSIPVLREPLRQALLKQAQLFYLTQNADRGLEFLQSLPAKHGFVTNDWEYHLWYGNTLFVRGIFQQDSKALASDLQGALREFQTALELKPNSWDARYNYEFIKQALSAEGEAAQKKLDLLLEEKARDKRRKEEIPPDKIG